MPNDSIRKPWDSISSWKNPISSSFLAGSTAIAIRGPEKETPVGDVFNPFRVGLDHLALACEDEDELNRVAELFSQAGVENTGVKTDETLNKQYVAFKDPDGISWEYYMA